MTNQPKFNYNWQVIYDIHKWYFSLRIIKFKKLYKDFHSCDVPLSIGFGIDRRVDQFSTDKYIIVHFGINKRNISGLMPVGKTIYVPLSLSGILKKVKEVKKY